jgi:RNA polymerase sigma factor (sigma-70 family)
MNERRPDFELLNDFVRQHDQVAFSAVVQRHLNLVYGTALRKLADASAAEEVVQDVFAALARSAWRFGAADSVPAWLHKTTLHKANGWWRGEFRRRRREQTAVELGTTMKTPEEQPALRALVPLLDEALLSLREKDRAALLLRFNENQSFRDVGASLGVSEDAAQKRVGVALEKVIQFFQRRGFKTVTVVAAAAALGRMSASAPHGFAASMTQAALRTAPPGFVGLSLLSRIATSTVAQKTVVAVALLSIPVAWWYWKQNVHVAEARISANAPMNPQPEVVAAPVPILRPMVQLVANDPGQIAAAAPAPQQEKAYTTRLSGLIDLPGYKVALIEVSSPFTNLVRSRDGTRELVSFQTNFVSLKEGESTLQNNIPSLRDGIRIEVLEVSSATGTVRGNERGERVVYTFDSPEPPPLDGGQTPNVRLQDANFRSVLRIFSELANRTVLPHPRLAYKPVSLTAFAPDRAAFVEGLKSVLNENHVTTLADGDKFEWVVPEDVVHSLPKRSAPPASATMNAPGDSVPAGMTQFVNTPLDPVLEIYAQLIGRKQVGDSWPGRQFNLINQTPLTREELRYAFETLLAWQGLKVELVGDKQFRVVRSSGH